ncbi:MAG: Sensor protein basS/pmrB [Labilithrix sp.]|nr:Sensor protein basS/pmrB [Labilithrix sp.]
MSKGRLTRHELSWLLTQEAQNAAERLRVGVQFLRTQAPPPPAADEDPAQGVETSLDALDDVMKMLSNLNQRSTPQAGNVPAARRGRIDIAALIVEVAPDAHISIEPGSGTEVYGDEADLRRMIQVLVGHSGGGEGASVTVRREGEDVRVAVALGPDSSPTAETERAWLSRVAIRYGGRHELEGGSEVLIFPADGASDRSESAALRKELDEARKQGEVYARELAAVFDRGEEVTSVSTVPPAPGVPSEARLMALTKLCAGIASELRNTLGPAKNELASMRRHEITDEQLDTLRRRVSHTNEVVIGLGAIGELRADEMETEVDLVELARSTVKSLANMAERDEVKVVLRVSPEGGHVYARGGAKALAVLTRELVAHAIEASPRGSQVEVTVVAAEDAKAGARLVVDDSGSSLPASGRRTFLALETHAGAYGRPSGLPIFLAAELAACQGGMLELSDPPLKAADAGASGLRVAVTFAKNRTE